jgi:hypothetical protein
MYHPRQATEGLGAGVAARSGGSAARESGTSVIVDKAWRQVTQVTDRNVIPVKGEVVYQGVRPSCSRAPNCSSSTSAFGLPGVGGGRSPERARPMRP